MPNKKNYTKAEVLALCASYMSEARVDYVQKAADFAERAHIEQIRKSGEPYFVHPVQVAGILAELKMDPDTVITVFFHDVVEDNGISLYDIAYIFSHTFDTLVVGYSYIRIILYNT